MATNKGGVQIMKVLHQQWFTEGNQGRPIGIVVFQTDGGRRFIKVGTGGGMDKDKDVEMIHKWGREVTLDQLKAIFQVAE